MIALAILGVALAVVVVVALLAGIGVAILGRGVTKHEYRVFTAALIIVGALALAIISGAEITGGVTLALKADSWVVVAGPAALATFALALLRGES